jgi:hypothetical protein
MLTRLECRRQSIDLKKYILHANMYLKQIRPNGRSLGSYKHYPNTKN